MKAIYSVLGLGSSFGSIPFICQVSWHGISDATLSFLSKLSHV